MNFKLSTPERPQWLVRSICHESKIFIQARAALTFCTQQGSETYTPPLFHTHENKTILNLRGHIHLPAGKMAQEYYFAIALGTSRSEFLALGPRTAIKKKWHRSEWSSPAFTDTFPLVPTQAFGGQSLQQAYPPNPQGTGFALSHDPRCLTGVFLPRLENPHQRLTPKNWPLVRWNQWHQLPQPAIPQGTFCPDLQFPFEHFKHPIQLENLIHRHFRYSWKIPEWTPIAVIQENDYGRSQTMHLQTIDFHLDSGIATLDYLAPFSLPYAGYLETLDFFQAGIAP